MANIDEGINWEAVIKEANNAFEYLNGYSISYARVVGHFAFKMSNLWASGHAVDFEKFLNLKQYQ